MAMAGLKTIIVLSFILAIGFLLVILSSTLYDSFLPLIVVATYVVAPLPNWLCGKAQSADDFMDNGTSSIVELGRFITGFLVVMGIGSAAGCPGTLRSDPSSSDDHEHCWRFADLRDHYQFHIVLQGRGGVLRGRFMNIFDGRARCSGQACISDCVV
nr:vacuolar protein sorting-associated protein 55 [Quercus suber]